jgi:hypothetical protein
MASTLYASEDQSRFFHVPDDARLPEGPMAVRSLTGRELRVEPVAIEVFEVSSDEAKAIIGEQMRVFLGKARSLATAALAALRTPPAAQPSDAAPAPELTVEGLKAMARDLAQAAKETVNDPDVAQARMAQVSGALRAEGVDEDVVTAVEKLPERLREALQSDELAAAVDELTARLRAATAEIDAELNKKPDDA